MEMFLFVVYAVSAVITGAVLCTTGATKIKAAIEEGMVAEAQNQGYTSIEEMPGYIVTVSRVISWVAILALPVIPVVNTVLTLRLGRKVYRRMTAR